MAMGWGPKIQIEFLQVCLHGITDTTENSEKIVPATLKPITLGYLLQHLGDEFLLRCNWEVFNG